MISKENEIYTLKLPQLYVPNFDNSPTYRKKANTEQSYKFGKFIVNRTKSKTNNSKDFSLTCPQPPKTKKPSKRFSRTLTYCDNNLAKRTMKIEDYIIIIELLIDDINKIYKTSVVYDIFFYKNINNV